MLCVQNFQVRQYRIIATRVIQPHVQVQLLAAVLYISTCVGIPGVTPTAIRNRTWPITDINVSGAQKKKKNDRREFSIHILHWAKWSRIAAQISLRDVSKDGCNLCRKQESNVDRTINAWIIHRMSEDIRSIVHGPQCPVRNSWTSLYVAVNNAKNRRLFDVSALGLVSRFSWHGKRSAVAAVVCLT